jgi:hypothetical protein
LKVAYIVAQNQRREEVNLELLNKFYKDHPIVKNDATDRIPSEAYIDPKLAYTQTGRNTLINRSIFVSLF